MKYRSVAPVRPIRSQLTRNVGAVAVVVLAVAVAAGFSGCATRRHQTLRQLLAVTPAKQLSSYSFDPSSPLAARVRPAPDFLINYLNKMDGVDFYTDYPLSESERQTLDDCLALLPDGLKTVLERKLVGIFFVRGWIGGGMADYLLDDAGGIYTALVVNPETLSRALSDWVSFRERSAFSFAAPADAAVELKIAAGEDRLGLLYILLHEGAHIADFIDHYTPFVEPNMKELGYAVPETAFVNGIWLDYAKPDAAYDFTGRGELGFYGLGKKPLVPASRAESLYRSMEPTLFVSLYGSQNWAEDFAEYFVWHYLTRVLNEPYRIEIYRGGVLSYSYEPMAEPLILARSVTVADLEK